MTVEMLNFMEQCSLQELEMNPNHKLIRVQRWQLQTRRQKPIMRGGPRARRSLFLCQAEC